MSISCFGDQTLVDGVDEGGEGLAFHVAAFEVGAGFHGVGCGVGHIGRVVVAGENIGNGGAVGDDVAVEVPGVAQMIAQQHGVGARRSAVDRVVGAHRGLRVRLGNGGAEGGQIGVFEIVCGDVDVGLVAGELGAGVNGVVLGRGHHARMMRVVALHAGDEGESHAAGEEGVFAVGFLAAAPARIAKDVDVRRPEREPEELFMLIVTNGLVVLGARFGGDGLAHDVDEARVKRGGHADDLGEDGRGTGEGDAVQTLIPPVVFGHAQARDGGGVVAHLLHFFVQRHLRDEGVDALIDGERGVEPGLVGGRGLLGMDDWKDQEGRSKSSE